MIDPDGLTPWLAAGGAFTTFGVLIWLVRHLVQQVKAGDELADERIAALRADGDSRAMEWEQRFNDLKEDLDRERKKSEAIEAKLARDQQSLSEELEAVRAQLRQCRAESFDMQVKLDRVTRELDQLRKQASNLLNGAG